MTSHTITDPPHRRLGNPAAKFEAWIKTSDGYFVELQIGSGATQEQAERFVRETAAAPELVAALKEAVRIANLAREEWDKAPNDMRAGKLLIALAGGCPGYRADIDAIHAIITKATGTAP